MCNIHSIYNVYPIHIFWIYSLNFFDIHSVFIEFVMHIHKKYLGYTEHIQCISHSYFLDIQFKFL